MVKPCPNHNLPEEIVCVGQLCHKRIGCQLCINKHEHKFYLDTKVKQKDLKLVQEQIKQKLVHLQKYTKSNIQNLRLQRYKQKIQNTIKEQLLYFENKISEEVLNFNLWIQRISSLVKDSLKASKRSILQNWEKYNVSADKQLSNIEDYEKLKVFFHEGDWTIHDHVEKSVNFLYSEELLFRFNRGLDSLKKVINYHKAQDKIIMDWFQERRAAFMKYNFCPHQTFDKMINQYSNKPETTEFSEPKTKQQKDNDINIMTMMAEDQKAVLIYPQITYEPFQNINKLIRYDNQIFATSGGRAVNIWTRVSVIPQKTYPLNFPSYGLLSFIQYGKDDPESIVFGKSNGQLGLIDIGKQTCVEMPAHEAAVRDIIQFDSYHFLTASQDWSMKLWAMNNSKNGSKQKYFASERLKLTGSSGKLHCLCKFGPNVLAAGAEGTIKLWDIIRQSFDEIFAQQKQVYALTQIRHELFASGGQLKEIRVWDYRKTKAPSVKFPIDNVCDSILKYDENTIIFNDKNIVKAIDIRNFKQPILRLNNKDTFTHAVNSMTFLSDNEIGMGGSDNFVSIWKY